MADGIDAYTRGRTLVVAAYGQLDGADLRELRVMLERMSARSSYVDRAIVDLTQAWFPDPAALSVVLTVADEASEAGTLRLVCNRLMGNVMLSHARSGPLPVFDSIRDASSGW